MNCPSRTDQCHDEHPDWNQNPAALTSDLTTREDLNGTVNSRSFRNGLSQSDIQCPEDAKNLDSSLEKLPAYLSLTHTSGADAGRQLSLKEDSDTFSATRALAPVSHSTICPNGVYRKFRQHRAWVWWTVLLVFVASLSFYFGGLTSSLLSNMKSRLVGDLPIRRLSRRGTCSNDPSGAGSDYNTPLHVGALVIILAVSSLACSFPLMAVKVPWLRIPSTFLFIVRHFGTGVLLATAFIHLLPTAFGSLNNPCLPSFWTTDYQPMPGAISLLAVFLVTIVEMVFSPSRHCCSGGADVYTSSRSKDHENTAVKQSATSANWDATKQESNVTTDASMRRDHPLVGNSNSMGRELAHMNAGLVEMERIEASQSPNAPATKAIVDEQSSDGQVSEDGNSIKLTPQQHLKKAVMQCTLLEMGILFHSVFIGMALSVSVGGPFIVLLVAISFHQTFEGLALGSRIAVINWGKNTAQPWIMALLYGCTTPIGQAIGLATHTLYDPDSEVGLVMVGVMNAISSGLLIYSSMIELLGEDFLSDESWRILRGNRRVIAFFLVFLGAFAMSLVGAWA
ncbi:hypothetical protein ACO22_07560 [Paracoccidioides brasiliensis]|uniref:Uncharacterized protein n=1 Tax=Paracoccidioides brasiliensis TaxID=121759 RepID=A0A1D2J4D4_PARBR|nr:hypothetical protein ACO22_07560 [Paracoccidioides brasiliensis]